MMEAKSLTLNIVSLPEQISEALRDGILNGRWKPGDQIVESRVAREMGVGQNAVREALQGLEFEGLVIKFPNRGNFVTRLSKEDIDQAYQVRVELESLAVEWARRLKRPDPNDYQRLEEILQRMEDGAKKKEFLQYLKADLDFHRGIWQLSGNKPLVKALDVVSTPMFSHVIIQFLHERVFNLMEGVKEHRDWLENIKTSSPKAASSYTRQLTLAVWKKVGDELEKRSP